MNHYIIMCRSISQAQRAVKSLERTGIIGYVVRPPSGITQEGCTYAVKILERHYPRAVTVLKSMGIGYGKIYIQGNDGMIKEIRA